MQELGDITREPPPGMKVRLADESNVHVWEILIDGPEQSAYAACLLRQLTLVVNRHDG